MPTVAEVEFHPTPPQAETMRLMLRVAVWTWNWGLEIKKLEAAAGNPKRGNYDVLKERIKTELPEEFRGVSSMVVQQAMRELETANYSGKQYHHAWVEEQTEDTFFVQFVGELLSVAQGKIVLPKVGRVAFTGDLPADLTRVSKVRFWIDDGRFIGQLTCRTADESRAPSGRTTRNPSASRSANRPVATSEELNLAAKRRLVEPVRQQTNCPALLLEAVRLYDNDRVLPLLRDAYKGDAATLRYIAERWLSSNLVDQFRDATTEAREILGLPPVGS